jgi:Rrf2 family cysteine metabolism transcriptional repressor
MMFSTKAEYGVRVMVALAQRAMESPTGEEPVVGQGEDGPGRAGHQNPSLVSLAEIAERDGLPLAYLEHLVARLRKAGLIESRRGSRGGYMLARAPAEIKMAEVVEALEGSIAPIECISLGPDGSIVCSRESDPAHVCPTKLLWTRVRFAIVSTLMETTLADLLVGAALPATAARTTTELPLAATAPAAKRLAQTTPAAKRAATRARVAAAGGAAEQTLPTPTTA